MVISETQDSGIFDDNAEAKANLASGERAILSMDSLFLFIIVGLSLFVIISASMIYNHPAFFIIGFFTLGIALILAAIMSNSFWSFTNTSTVMSSASNFPKMIFIMNNLPFYLVFEGIASLVAGIIGYKGS
jgi:uncharacterized membrane protein YphA (DoxX/SURF4 family)